MLWQSYDWKGHDLVKMRVNSIGRGEKKPRLEAEWWQASLRYLISETTSPGPGNRAVLARLAEVLFMEVLRWQLRYAAENRSGWDSNVVFDLHAAKAKPEVVTIPDHPETPPLHQDDNLKAHTDNWFHCMRNRQTPNGSIETGFAHAIAVVMATRSYREGKKLHWDRQRQEITA